MTVPVPGLYEQLVTVELKRLLGATHSAMLDGVEWNVRLAQASTPDLIEKFKAAFESYWADPDYEAYDPARDADRFDRAVRATVAVRRHRKHEAGRTAAYTCLGAAEYVSHEGSRPIAIRWRLRRPMPDDFFREAKVAAG